MSNLWFPGYELENNYPLSNKYTKVLTISKNTALKETPFKGGLPIKEDDCITRMLLVKGSVKQIKIKPSAIGEPKQENVVKINGLLGY